MNTRPIILLLIVSALLPAVVSRSAEKMTVRNFTPDIYGVADNAFCFGQDDMGRILVGNTGGMLTFNSKDWIRHSRGSGLPVFSFLLDTIDMRVYAGSMGDFGYFSSVKGRGEFTSLKSTVSGETLDNEYFGAIARCGSDVWISSAARLIRIDSDNSLLFTLPDTVTALVSWRSAPLAALADGSLLTVKDYRVEPMPRSSALAGKRIVAMHAAADGSVIIVTARDGLWIYDERGARRIYPSVNPLIRHSGEVTAAAFSRDSVFAIAFDGGTVAVKDRSGIRTATLDDGLRNTHVEALMFDRDGNLWCGGIDGIDYIVSNSGSMTRPPALRNMSNEEIIASSLKSYDPADDDDLDGAYVCAIYSATDSLLYEILSRRDTSLLEIPYRDNTLRFEFIDPEFSSDNSILYSSRLDNGEWTSFSPTSSRTITNIGGGDHSLSLRSINLLDGRMHLSEFRFRVELPWYRTLWARLLFGVVAAAGLWVVWRLLRRFSRRAARLMERKKNREMALMKENADNEARRKDNEIASLRSEQADLDNEHRTRELNSSTMSLVRKNEILLGIAARLTKIQQMPEFSAADQAVVREISGVQAMIQQHIGREEDGRDFSENFDHVYEDFTRLLMATHPDLNSADRRLCCYLKMGLTTKDIAALLNVNPRSVEMARYRLRKKMNLPRSTNLSEYLRLL